MATDKSKNTEQQSYDYLFKVLLIGDKQAGKSALLKRFAEGSFSENYTTTIGIDFMTKTTTFAGTSLKLQIWDTAGQERFRNITNSYYRGAHAILIVFDLSDRKMFENLENWYETATTQGPENCAIGLVGTKTDLTDRKVTQEEAEAFAEKHDIVYAETSARDNNNVDQPFLQVTKKLLQSKGTSISWWKKQTFQ